MFLIIKDFMNINNLKPIFITEILKYISIHRIMQRSRLKLLSEKIEEYFSQYKKDIIDICYYYGIDQISINFSKNWNK